MTADREAEIAKRAYHIWESKGQPSDKALDHWLQAEAELATEAASPATSTELKPSKPVQGRRKGR